jgi:hypothetical protein
VTRFLSLSLLAILTDRLKIQDPGRGSQTTLPVTTSPFLPFPVLSSCPLLLFYPPSNPFPFLSYRSPQIFSSCHSSFYLFPPSLQRSYDSPSPPSLASSPALPAAPHSTSTPPSTVPFQVSSVPQGMHSKPLNFRLHSFFRLTSFLQSQSFRFISFFQALSFLSSSPSQQLPPHRSPLPSPS